MKVLLAHTAYQQRGGEDVVVDAEVALLREAGHEVIEYRRHNDEIRGMRPADVAIDTLWSRRTLREVDDLLAGSRPDVVHVHNTFPLMSPTLHEACRRRGVPLVQTLHNFRLGCPGGTLLRDGQPCEACVGRLPWPGVRHGCFRGSAAQTAVLAASTVLHRWRGTLDRAVHRYIALSRFARDKLVAMGLPAERLAIKPNFVPDPNRPLEDERQGLLYVGRLAEEKGVAVLAAALQVDTGGSALPVRVAGSGPLEPSLRGCAGALLLGHQPAEAVLDHMARSVAVVLPSVCYEGFPRTLVEAWATGTPVIASRIGALAELVEEGRTGLLVPPGDAAALHAALQWALAHPQAMRRMGEQARQRYLHAFTPAHNLPRLLQIYDEAIGLSCAERTIGAPP